MGTRVCLHCGYRWNSSPRPSRCPNCKTEEWDKESEIGGEACGLDGGICDQCDCRFTTEIGKAKYCPNCGSDKWDAGKVTENPSVLIVTENPSREYECTKCGHHWFSRVQPRPKQCPRKACQTRKIKEVVK